jgi:alpha-D-ribose 1-methylphosphonate 5-triphosphate synthase subunit PhnG
MTASTLTISGKVMGKTQPLFTNWQLSIPTGTITLQDLLAQIVRSEVAEFKERQTQRRLTRILSAADIGLGVARGKIEAGGSELDQAVDVEGAIDTALQAFKDGFYLVFINDQQQEDLADLVEVGLNSEMLFLRLTPLVGG